MPSAPARVLVVDDSKVIRSLLTAELEAKGLVVDTAEDGVSALAKGNAAPWDLILIDAMMPDLSGFEVCRRLASLRRDGKPILVMFSNRTKDFAARQQAQSAGADAFLTKNGAARVADDVAQLLAG